MTDVRQTVLSPCRKYRYTLWRDLGDLLSDADRPFLMVIGLNPSTADETKDDPTIRRCKTFAAAWGFSGLLMANLFAFRATDPGDMIAAADPVGPENDRYLAECAGRAGMVLAAWGCLGSHNGRSLQVLSMLNVATVRMRCLKKNADGSPQHPLYVAGNTTPVPYP